MSTSYEGFWESKEQPHLPHPSEFQHEKPIDAAWLEKFTEVEFWASKHYFLGCSHCRLCEKDENGCATFLIKQGLTTWCFPEGLRHYFEQHNVHPSRRFYKFVLAYRRPTADEFVNSLLRREQEVSAELVLPSQRFARFALTLVAAAREQEEERSREIAVLVKLAISAADHYPQDIRERLQSSAFVDSLPAQIQMHLKDPNLGEKFREQVVQGELRKLMSGTAELKYSN